MKSRANPTTFSLFLAVTMIMVTAKTAATAAPPVIPNPVLYLTRIEPIEVNGKQFLRYNYDILNKADYPAALFAAAPALPPCGANHNASRTWVDFYDQRGARLNGFCALGKPGDLGQIWFALESNVLPPSYIYVELTDRQTNTKYRSNLADTVI